MRLRIGPIMLVAAVLTLLAAGLPASADHETRPHTQNVHAKGHSPHPATSAPRDEPVRGRHPGPARAMRALRIAGTAHMVAHRAGDPSPGRASPTMTAPVSCSIP